jgi:signal transduction histidine kinase/ligand-binding sensor domain-containing protein
MARGRGRGRGVVTLGIVLAGVLLARCPGALALNPALDVNQYTHTAWKIREGFTKGVIDVIAQTPDGYVWLGTEFGLLRFDGVRTVPWRPPPDQHLPPGRITGLLAAGDGTLWIGADKGFASLKDGKLTQYPELAGQHIYSLLEDWEGTVWAGVLGFPTGRLCAIHNGSVHCYGEDGSLGHGVFGLYEDRKANLWVGVLDGLWRWKPGPPKFYSLPGELDGIRALAEDDDGALLVGWQGGIRRLVDGKTEAYPLPGPVRQFQAKKLLRDRDGGLWIATSERGLVHVHQGRTDVFAQSDGLSGDHPLTLFEDREGNIWVTTYKGLDHFRDFAVATFTVNQGLSDDSVESVLAASDGSVWLSTSGGLDRWNHGQMTTLGKPSGQNQRSAEAKTGGNKRNRKFNGDAPNSLFQDGRGRIWVSTSREFGYLENERFTSVRGIPGGLVHGIAEDTTGNLWIANQDAGLFKLFQGSEVQQIPWAKVGHKDYAWSLAADPLQGGLWLGFYQGGMVHFRDGQVRTSYTPADGLGKGPVNRFRFDPEGTVWAATEGGLSRVRNGRIATLSSKNGLPCDAVHWVIQDNDHAFWLLMACGLVRIARSEVDAWTAAAEKDKNTTRTIQATVFDSSDGVRSRAWAGGYVPRVARSSDGKLWFSSYAGVCVVDPRHLPFNKLPPPVHIEQITADRKTYDAAPAAGGRLRLPPLLRDLEIDYTALSLVAPEKVLFRYKLEGRDRDWQDVGNRRQAFYSDLPPRNYRFRVIACNNSGVWNEAGTLLDFSVAPAYYQTTWFRLLCLAAFLALLWALYQLRVRQVTERVRVQMEGRVAERERIARDFHDTLLQSFQGVLLKFSAISYRIPKHPEVQETLESVIEQARGAITEGRDAVQGLRTSTVISNNLAQAINTFAEGLAADPTCRNSCDFRLHVEGASRDLAPLVRDEVHRIVGEVLRNAFRHSQAERIEVEIHYDRRQLRVRIKDNGKGIDPKVLAEGGRPGHHGLPGMQERAKLVGGKLSVWSELNAGTETELTIPASVAYSKKAVTRQLRSSENQ